MSPEPPIDPASSDIDALRGAAVAEPVQDTLAQTFAAILVQLRAAAELAERDPATAAVFRRQAELLAETGLAEARRGVAPDATAAALTRALGRLARWADTQRLCACSFAVAGSSGELSPAVTAAAYDVARTLIVDAVECRALRRIDVTLVHERGRVRLALDGELVADAPPGWLDRMRARVDGPVRSAAGTLSVTTDRDRLGVRVVAEFETG